MTIFSNGYTYSSQRLQPMPLLPKTTQAKSTLSNQNISSLVFSGHRRGSEDSYDKSSEPERGRIHHHTHKHRSHSAPAHPSVLDRTIEKTRKLVHRQIMKAVGFTADRTIAKDLVPKKPGETNTQYHHRLNTIRNKSAEQIGEELNHEYESGLVDLMIGEINEDNDVDKRLVNKARTEFGKAAYWNLLHTDKK